MKKAVLLSALSIVCSHAVAADDRPMSGLVFSTTEWSSLQYECSLQGDGQIFCSMAQASVSRTFDGRSLKEQIAKGLTSLKTDKPMKPEECDGLDKMVAMVKSPQSAPERAAKEIMAMDPMQKNDILKSLSAAVEFCRAPSAETMTKLVSVNFEKDSRTCNVSAHQFTMVFKKVDDNAWASNVGPSGPCGVVTIARLEREPGEKLFWNYVQRKVVTNPNATAIGAMKCSELDEQEYRYSWRSREIYAKCDYVKLGLF